METRKTDGSLYPPTTLRSLVSGLNRVLQSNKAPFSVLDKGDCRFKDLHKTLDSLSSDMHRQGIGATKNSAKVIVPEHEGIFWQKLLLGYSTPKVLQRTVFFYVGLNFVLRGVQEQYDLIPSQFVRSPQDKHVYDSSVYYEYTELISKNNQHRFKDINAQNKVSRAYALPGNERCVVRLLDKYLSLLPCDAPYLYMRMLENVSTDSENICATKQRVGINLLKRMVPELSEKSGIGVRYTNHSLRATAITQMFTSGISEKVIADTSGHRSTKALRCYEHTSEQQQQAVSAVINRCSEAVACQPPEKNLQPPEKKLRMPLSENTLSQNTLSQNTLAQKTVTPNFSGSFQNCTFNVCFN